MHCCLNVVSLVRSESDGNYRCTDLKYLGYVCIITKPNVIRAVCNHKNSKYTAYSIPVIFRCFNENPANKLCLCAATDGSSRLN